MAKGKKKKSLKPAPRLVIHRASELLLEFAERDLRKSSESSRKKRRVSKSRKVKPIKSSSVVQ